MKVLLQHVIMFYFHHIPGNAAPGWDTSYYPKLYKLAALNYVNALMTALVSRVIKNVETFAMYLSDSNSNDIFALSINSVFIHCVE